MVAIARVKTGRVPQQADADVEPFLKAEIEGGRVVDWRIDYRRVLESGDVAYATETISRWRQAWAWERLLGRGDAVAGMVDAYVGVGGEPPALLAGLGEQLSDGRPYVIDNVDELRVELEQVRERFVASGARGWALFTPQKRGTVWASAWQDSTDTVAAGSTSSVVCGPDGFRYIRGGEDLPLIGWAQRGNRVRLSVGERAGLDERRNHNHAAEWIDAEDDLGVALGLAVGGADPIRSIQLTYAGVYATVIVALKEACDIATAVGEPIRLYVAEAQPVATP